MSTFGVGLLPVAMGNLPWLLVLTPVVADLSTGVDFHLGPFLSGTVAAIVLLLVVRMPGKKIHDVYIYNLFCKK